MQFMRSKLHTYLQLNLMLRYIELYNTYNIVPGQDLQIRFELHFMWLQKCKNVVK